MELLRIAALSPWGAASIASAAAAIAALWMRRRVLAVAATAAALAFLGAALDVAGPEARRAEARAAADARLAAAVADIADGFNLDAAAGLRAAEESYRAAASTRGVARVAVARGELARVEGRLDDARRAFAVAVQMRDVAPAAAAHALIGLALVTAARGDLAAAAAIAGESVAALRRGDPDGLLAEALLVGGTLARRGAALGLATERLTEAGRLFAEAGQTLGRARAVLELAAIQRDLVAAGAAERLAGQAAELFEAADVPYGFILADVVVGWGASDNEQPERAVALFRGARARLDEFPDPIAEAARFLGLSRTGTLQVRPEDGRTPEQNQAAAVANLAAFPNHHIEARKLIDWTRNEIELGIIRAGRDQ